MGVKLLIGGAGTGKTRRCIKLLQSYLEAGRGAEVVFLLPNEEQVNEIKEMLLQELALPGFLDSRILTFADLSSRLVGRALRPATRSRPHPDLNCRFYRVRRWQPATRRPAA